jgi:type I restriction enzyme M protein
VADLYLRKTENADDYPIFMAIAEKIGYDATGKSIQDYELGHGCNELRKSL